MGVLPGVVHSSSTPSFRVDVHMAFYVPSISRAGAPPQGMSWLTTIVVSFLGTISISLTWQGGETWLLFNNLSHFDDFTPYLVCPDLTTTSRRRSSGDWMKTLEDHMGHRGLPLIPELEMVISFWSLPARSRPLYLPLLAAAQGPPLPDERHPLWLASALEAAQQVVDQGGNSADMHCWLQASPGTFRATRSSSRSRFVNWQS